MSASIIWLIVALLVLGTEMMLGTIYLLAICVGAFAASLTAVLNGDLTLQCISGAIVAVTGVVLAFFCRKKFKKLSPENIDSLDKGQMVNVTEVLQDGTAKVNYRGALWIAYTENAPLETGSYQIKKVVGNRLLLCK